MQIVIDLPEEIYNNFMNDWVNSPDIFHAVRRGTPLPKGHGRLVDADALVKSDCYWETEYEVTNAPTIIEADQGGVIE